MRSHYARLAWALILCLGVALAPSAAAAQQSKAPATEKININTATLEQLQTLDGVGPALAKAIVEHRTKNGKFAKIEEIIKVKGMGEKKFLRIKDRLVV